MGRDMAAAEEDDDWNTADPDTIMIPNSQSSPTTGAYYSMPTQNLSYRDDEVDDCLYTNQHTRPGDGDLNSLPYFYGLQNQDLGAAYLKQQQLLDFEIPTDISDMNISRVADFPRCTNMNKFSSTFMPNLDLTEDNNISLSIDRTVYKNEGNQYVVKDEERASRPLTGVVNLNASEDEYNWRKYGQKQVKGSKYPRSYYKCTHPNCEAKKKAERAQNGNITQIIYKGKHNHPKPIPNRRLPPGSAFVHDETDTGEDYSSHAKIEGESVWKDMNSVSEDDRVGSIKWRSAGLDTELAESVLNQLSIANPPGLEKYFNPLDSDENEEVSSPPHRQDVDDEDIDETDSKRRRTDDCMLEPNTSSRGIREDKIMVQAESVIDIIDDGYRWRKYGQKVVKDNPNPRSYYKCTSAGCLVRKHVERNPQNIKDVITTYEGKHNHEVPPAKNSSSPNKNVGHLPSVPFTGQASHMSLTRSSTLPKVQMPDHISPHFRRTSFPGNEFLNPGLIGNYGTAMNFGSSSVYHSDFPMPYRSLGLNMPNLDNPQVGMTSSHASDLISQQPLLTHPGSLNSNMTPAFKIRVSQLGHHPSHDLDVIRPKQEKVDNITDDSSASKANSNESSSLPPHYGQGFPS